MSEVKTSAIKEKSLEEILGDGREIVIRPMEEEKKTIDEEEKERTKDEIERYVEENEEMLKRVAKHGSRSARIFAKAFLERGGKKI